MKRVSRISAVRSFRRSRSGPCVLVPTMGALHQGHAALIRRARKLAGSDGWVAVSVFVNPTQFGPNEDYQKYPRPLLDDARLCRDEGVDLFFHPAVDELIPCESSTWVEELEVSRPLCGANRPGHFRGVSTIVARLFLVFQPEVAVFGEKDWQQLAVIRRMVRDLHFPVRIVGVPTAREEEGLAISSRNRYLSTEQRKNAAGLYRSLRSAADLVRQGETSTDVVRRFLWRKLRQIPGASIDYAEVVDASSLQSVSKIQSRILLAVAVKFGATRLIDNLRVEPTS